MGSRISKQHPFINMGVWANEEKGSACRRCKEGNDAWLMQGGKDVVLAMVLMEDMVLAMVLIEDVLVLLMMIEDCWF